MPEKTDQPQKPAETKVSKSKIPDLRPGKAVKFYLKQPLIIERKKDAIPAGEIVGEIKPASCLSPQQLCDLVRSGRATMTPPAPEEDEED